MVPRRIKIPRHGGPDGQGLPQAVFDHLVKIIKDTTVSDEEAQGAVLLAFSASTQREWNNEYRAILQSICIDNTDTEVL